MSQTKKNEELYRQNEHLVHATLKRQYPNYHDFAKSHGLDVDDLLQLGKIGLHKATLDYNPSMGTSFRTYAVNKISYALMTEPKLYSTRNENNRTYKLSGESSIDALISIDCGDPISLSDMLEEKVDFIQDAEFNVILDNIANKISPNLATAVKMKYENYTLKQIGEKLNMSSQAVNQMLKFNKQKLMDLMLA